MSSAPGLYARTVYQAALFLRGETGVFSRLDELRRLESASPEEIRERQRTRLSRVLDRAADVPFHRRRWGDNTSLDGGDVVGRLRSLPFLEKSHLQEHREELISEETGRTATKRTGGSTAEPVEVLKSSSGMAVERAVSWLGYGWYGVQPGSKVARFWGTPLTAAGRLKFRLADLAMRRIRFSAFELEPEDLDEYWRRCVRFGPEWLYGYTSILDLFAQHVEERGWDGGALDLRSIVCTSEPLDELQRARLEEVFDAPVQNEYGCGETGAIAYSCEEGRLHVMTESVLVEVLDEDGRPVDAGESGEVVVTDLNNFAMPLVRYRLRDYATRGPRRCGCGRPWPTLEKVWGRAYDVLYTPEGRRWHGEKMKYLLVELHEQYGGFDQFQIVQVSPDTLDVRLVTDRPIDDEVRRRIQTYADDRLDGMKAEVRSVDAVERESSGKLRVVRNDWLENSAS